MADQTKVVVGVAIKNKQNTGGSCSTGIPTQSKDILVDGSTGTTLDVALDNITTEIDEVVEITESTEARVDEVENTLDEVAAEVTAQGKELEDLKASGKVTVITESETNGNFLVNGNEIKVYRDPSLCQMRIFVEGEDIPEDMLDGEVIGIIEDESEEEATE